MGSKLERVTESEVSVIITNALGTTEEIDFAKASAMHLFFPATWTTATVAVYSQNPADGEYYPLYNASGAVTFTGTQSTSYAMSESIFAGKKLKLVSNNAANNAIVCGGTMKS